MNKEFHYLYKYIEKEELSIDLNEFELQIQAHPAYPSLLSVIDTLNHFDIENSAFQIDLQKIEFLPNRFVGVLSNQYYLVEKKKKYYIYYNSQKKIKISKKELESIWGGIVILIENSERKQIIKFKKNKLFWIIPIFISLLIITITSLIEETITNIFLFQLPAIGLIFSISFIQKLLIDQKELKKFQLKANQFINNYEIFKSTLLTSAKITDNLAQSSAILLGNEDAYLKIIMVINPFSALCKEAHTIMEQILQKYFNIVCFDVRFNFNQNDYNIKKSKRIHQQLVALYFDHGQEGFMKGLKSWFGDKDDNNLNEMEVSPTNEMLINEILNAHFNSNLENNLIFTPEIIINNYLFPKQYDKKKLIQFIDNLSEDEDFLSKE